MAAGEVELEAQDLLFGKRISARDNLPPEGVTPPLSGFMRCEPVAFSCMRGAERHSKGSET